MDGLKSYVNLSDYYTSSADHCEALLEKLFSLQLENTQREHRLLSVTGSVWDSYAPCPMTLLSFFSVRMVQLHTACKAEDLSQQRMSPLITSAPAAPLKLLLPP